MPVGMMHCDVYYRPYALLKKRLIIKNEEGRKRLDLDGSIMTFIVFFFLLFSCLPHISFFPAMLLQLSTATAKEKKKKQRRKTRRL